MKALLWVFAPVVCVQTFEVASIKQHPGEVRMSQDPMVRGTQVTAVASTLVDMITSAYDVRYDQVTGGPEWIKTVHYDLDAKVPGDVAPTQQQANLMMQHLLAERFQLRVRRETRQVPVFALVVGRNGPKFQESPPEAPAGTMTRGTDKGLRRESVQGSMSDLAIQLSVTAGRPVVDKTGLKGLYTYTLEWFPANRVPPPDSNLPSMFAALEEQMGLRLVTETGLQEYLVIEHAERPSEN